MAQASYNHAQRSYFSLIIFAVVAAIFLPVAIAAPEPAWLKGLLFALAGLFLAIGFVFSSLTVTADEQSLSWSFGSGFWKKTIARSDIISVEAVTTKWWHGWGIRWTPDGWLYNVSGFDAVAVTTRQGKTVMIGTDEPDALVAALGN